MSELELKWSVRAWVEGVGGDLLEDEFEDIDLSFERDPKEILEEAFDIASYSLDEAENLTIHVREDSKEIYGAESTRWVGPDQDEEDDDQDEEDDDQDEEDDDQDEEDDDA